MGRMRILRKFLLDRPDWEMSTSELIEKLNPKRFKQKRIGAKAAKAAERFEPQGEVFHDIPGARGTCR